ncbi:MAG: sugar ABC transporter permease [Ruminococcaceae bacterium]|nr:sugar ABC transporter permease [Oscillospiraceae bacterium]
MIRTSSIRKKNAPFLFACIAPAALLCGLFVIYPAFSIFRISLYKWGGYTREKVFVGLDNYKILFSDSRFLHSLRNSLILLLTVTAVTLVISLFTAYLLTESSLKLKSFFRVVFYIPNILSVVVVSAIFSAIYDPRRGLLNSLLSVFGISGPLWLGERELVIYSIALAMIWQASGYYMVMYMAAMGAVPKSLYEAAEVEGAGSLRRFFSVTLPSILPQLRTTLTFFVISNINISFLLVRAMTGGGPDGASEVLLSYMYKQSYTNSSYGYGMAIGSSVFILSFAVCAAVNFITRPRD